MAKKRNVPAAAPPLALLIPEVERDDSYRDPEKSRYTHCPNMDLAHNQTVSRGSTMIREPRVKDGVSFNEPVAGQGFNDQFPWR